MWSSHEGAWHEPGMHPLLALWVLFGKALQAQYDMCLHIVYTYSVHIYIYIYMHTLAIRAGFAFHERSPLEIASQRTHRSRGPKKAIFCGVIQALLRFEF